MMAAPNTDPQQGMLFAPLPKQRRTRKNSQPPNVIEHYAKCTVLLDAALVVIERHLGKLLMVPTHWRNANKKAASQLVELGITPERVSEMLETAFQDRFYPRTPMLAKLQEHWSAVEDRVKNGDRARPRNGPRVDSCGCPLPDGVTMPRLGPGEQAHWDGDQFIVGDA